MSPSNYAAVIRDNLQSAFQVGEAVLSERLKARSEAGELAFKAFGAECLLGRDGVRLNDETAQGPRGVIISLLARHARPTACIEEPWRAFRELPDSMPYVGAFRSHTELPLIPHVEDIRTRSSAIVAGLGGSIPERPVSGDFNLVLQPLPKIRLCYLFYRPDDEFPAQAICLFSANAQHFLPTDALADVGEYTSRAMMDMLGCGGMNRTAGAMAPAPGSLT
ncbi:MAG: DUF3786 domain-containing protein [Desulfosarcina sp.]|nr:DUF3786 domain-containing protein [Desulfobacterales bacterium]